MPMQFSGSLEELIAQIRHICQNSSDILINRISVGGIPCAVFTCEGMLSTAIFTELVIDPLMQIPVQPNSQQLFQYLEKNLLLSLDRPIVRNEKEFFRLVYSGFVVIAAEGQNFALAFGVQGYEKRSVSEPSGEANLFGAHDGLTESVRTNMSLIRRRMKTTTLKFELSVSGKLSQTDICLCWLTDRVPPQLLQQVKQKLQQMQLDTILSPGYIQPFLEKCRGKNCI